MGVPEWEWMGRRAGGWGWFVRGAVAAGSGAGRQPELNLRGVLGIEGAAPAALACLPASRPPSPHFRTLTPPLGGIYPLFSWRILSFFNPCCFTLFVAGFPFPMDAFTLFHP